jgi:flagellar protein FliO/FliZ
LSTPSTAAIGAASVPVPASSGGSWFVLVVLTLLVITVAVVLWVYRRRLNFVASDPHIKVLATQFVGTREKIVVVDVYGRTLVLGHTPAQLSLICELDSTQMPPETKGQGSLSADFSKVISRFVRPEGKV